MKKGKWNKLLAVFVVMVTALSLLPGCGGKRAEKEDAETITVYLWTTNLYEKIRTIHPGTAPSGRRLLNVWISLSGIPA